MIIGGLQKMSLVDYPEKISAIVFTQGCNFRCRFCYNPMLVWPLTELGEKKYQQGLSLISEADLFDFLKSRQGKLDAIVITGGEPTLHRDLPEFLRKIKDLGFLIKLDTNGTNPEAVKKLLDQKLLDYIAMDIKGPDDKYEAVVGVPVDLEKIKESVKIISKSGLPYEFRTTIAPGVLNKDDIAPIGEIIRGAAHWYLQKFKSDTDLVDEGLENHLAYTDKEMDEMALIGSQYALSCKWR